METVLARLKEEYPDSRCSLTYDNGWQLLIATILSAQCTDERVNEVSPKLFDAFPTPDALAMADPRQVEAIVRPTGFYRNKAKNIQGASKAIVEDHGGEVPDNIQDLVALPGVARKTANVVLHVWFDHPEGSGAGIVVDTHVTRVAGRLGFTPKKGETDAKRIEAHLQKIVPKPDWGLFTHLIIDHGRAVCTGRSRPKCEACVLNDVCPSAFTF